jgi:hypothetical protein
MVEPHTIPGLKTLDAPRAHGSPIAARYASVRAAVHQRLCRMLIV